MENQIYNYKEGSCVVHNNELWIGSKKYTDLEKFQSAVQNTGFMSSAYSIPLDNISEIKYNDESTEVKFTYTNENDKKKNTSINFGDKATSNAFGDELGEQLGMNKSVTQEGKLMPLLINSLLALGMIFLTYYVGTMNDTSELESSSSRRSRGKLAILRLIVDTLGQTAVLIIGGLISVFLIYLAYKRYTNPANEVVYTRT